jgi:hypothetical protein
MGSSIFAYSFSNIYAATNSYNVTPYFVASKLNLTYVQFCIYRLFCLALNISYVTSFSRVLGVGG